MTPLLEKRQYVAVTDREDFIRWLKDALGPDAELAVCEQNAPERVLQLVDATGSGVVFVGFDLGELRSNTRLVERLLEAKPYLAVVAVADERDDSLLLAAMRSGARDFLHAGGDPLEVQSQVTRLLERSPAAHKPAGGHLLSILSARPGEGAATLAVHLALALAEEARERKVLLLDLGVPAGDTLYFLDMKPSYNFIDAIRSVRRFDETLIETAFARHQCGLAVLPMTGDVDGRVAATQEDALVLIGILKHYFDVVVANLGGMAPTDVLAQIVNRTDHAYVLAEQSVVSCNANRELLNFLDARGTDGQALELVVDRYLPKLELDAHKVSEVLALPLVGTLPSCGMDRLRAMNAGYSIFELSRRGPYAKGVRRLARRSLEGARGDPRERGGGRVLGRLLGTA